MLHKEDSLDRYDFLMGAVTGIGAGLLDAYGVNKPGEGILGQFTDKKVDDAVMYFARKKGWKPSAKQANNVRSAIGFLEDPNQYMRGNMNPSHRINYDQAYTDHSNEKMGTNGLVDDLIPANHHLKSLGHSPDLIGLIVSVLNQFTATSTFVSNGKIITIDTATLELVGDNFPAKVFSGCSNWFWHLMSDVAGSSGSTNRGSGLPIPFYNLFLLCDFGAFKYKNDNLTYAQIMTKVFEHGYDLRHGIAMTIPLLVGELLTMLCWSFKRRFYHKWDWKDCIPGDQYKTYRRCRLIHSSAFCMVDGAHAYFKGHGDPVEIILHMNLFAWLRLVKLIIKELFITYGRTYADVAHDMAMINQALEEELEKLKAIDYAAWQQENEITVDFNKQLLGKSDLEIGDLAGNYVFSHGVKLNYSDFDGFDELFSSNQKLW